MKNNTIKMKKATLEVLERLMDCLDSEESYMATKTVWYDTDQPRLNEDGTPKTRDDGSIIYKQDYREEPRPESELSDDDKLKLKAIDEIRKQLEKLA